MKTKITFLLGLLLVCLQVNAQLKVLPNGKVGIGTTNPQYGSLQIGKSGVNNGISIYDSLSTLPPLKFYTLGKYCFLNFGVQQKGLAIRSDGRFAIGSTLKTGYESISNALLSLYVYPENYSAALMVHADYPVEYADVIKVYSYKNTDMAYVVKDVSKGTDELSFFVRGDGEVFAKGSYLTASDEIYKDDITEINNGLDKIKKIKGVTYMLKDQMNESEKVENAVRRSGVLDTTSFKASIPIEIIDKINLEKQRKKAGFIAQELEQVFPEAVYTLPNGKKAIAYSEIIPLLVEAIKEQQSEIDELKQAALGGSQTRAAINTDDEQSDSALSIDKRGDVILYGNTPNPFKEETTISYFIPEHISQATLHIYNLQGKQIKQIVVSERGNGAVIIKGYEFTPGMYMYTLIVDGKEIDTKKMILTE